MSAELEQAKIEKDAAEDHIGTCLDLLLSVGAVERSEQLHGSASVGIELLAAQRDQARMALQVLETANGRLRDALQLARARAFGIADMVASEAYAMGISGDRFNDGPDFNDEAELEKLCEKYMRLHWSEEHGATGRD